MENGILDTKALQLLHAFAQVCGRLTLAREDWHKLYAFSLYVHRQVQRPTARDVREFLIAQGCSIQKASFLAAEYDHFAELLRLYDEQNRQAVSAAPLSV